VKQNGKLVHKCGFRFRGRASEQAEPKIGFSESGWAPKPRFHDIWGENFVLFRRASGKCETTFVNQLSILFHKCGLRFSGRAAEDFI